METMHHDPAMALAIKSIAAGRFAAKERRRDRPISLVLVAIERSGAPLLETVATTPSGASAQLRLAARWIEDRVDKQRLRAVASRIKRGELCTSDRRVLVDLACRLIDDEVDERHVVSLIDRVLDFMYLVSRRAG